MAKPRYIERRFAPLDADSIEVREDSEGLSFRGHAAVFDQEVDFGFFREKVAPGAFSKTIKDGADVRFLFNHDPNTVMARTTVGNLRLSEDKSGLAVEADLDENDVDVQRLVPKLRSGNVTQMSFGFTVTKEEVEKSEEKSASDLRILREVQLFDVSPVTFPAYEGTDGSLKSLRDLYSFLGLPVAADQLVPDEASPFGVRWGSAPQARTFDDWAAEWETLKDTDVDEDKLRGIWNALTARLDEPELTEPLPAIGQHSQDNHSLSDLMRVLDLNRNRLVA